jgi:nucleoside-diphosphate-sugar epimerase
LIVIAGADGFIGGSLVRYFHNQGFTRIRALDKKPLPLWYLLTEGVENLNMTPSEKAYAVRAVVSALTRSYTATN